ncbi:MAG: dockerin type I repeat-containing protein [Candidatus Zixiibacteriota bacterium]
MKKPWCLFVLLVGGWMPFFLTHAASNYVSPPVTVHPVFSGELVPHDLAEKTASLFAGNLSSSAAPGPSVIYNGVDGQPAAYVFVYSLKDKVFPDEKQILSSVSQGWEYYDQGMKEGDQSKASIGKKTMTGEGDFLTIVVSARKQIGPVVEYFYGLPWHYTAKAKASDLAKKKLSSDQVTLSQYIYASPFDLWFEFESGYRKTYVSPLYFSTNSEEEVFVSYQTEMSTVQKQKIAGDWEKMETGQGIDFGKGQFRISGVPDFDWSYGCSPSAGADVLGYWDANGYGLLIDYYFTRWDPLEGEWDYNVPNVQQQLARAMNTDSVSTGGTYLSDMGPGIRMVCNHPDYANNYGFSDYTDYSQSLGYLINEIRLGYPAVWNVFSHPTYTDHSMCAMGWGPPDTTYICLHDTWSSTPTEVLVNWYGWSNERYTVAVRPGASSVYAYNNIRADSVSMNITNYGAVGDQTTKDFFWHGVDQLFDGTLILSWVVPGDTMIAMDMYNRSKDSWYPYSALNIRDTTFGQFGSTAFIDTIGMGVAVEQYSVGSSNPLYGDFILQQYVVKNTADTAIQAYLSLCLDWDVYDAYNNLGGMDQQHDLIWQRDPSATYKKYRFGILRVPTDDSLCYSAVAVRNPVYIWPQETWRKDQLWSLISTPGWTNYSMPDTDYGQLVTPGKLDLAPDSVHLESFVIFGVDSTRHQMNSDWWRPILSFCGLYRGDVDQDWSLNGGDIIYLVNYLFRDGSAPLPFADQGDVNRDGVVDAGDVVYLINYLFRGGPRPTDYNRFLPQPWKSKFVRPSLFANPNW